MSSLVYQQCHFHSLMPWKDLIVLGPKKPRPYLPVDDNTASAILLSIQVLPTLLQDLSRETLSILERASNSSHNCYIMIIYVWHWHLLKNLWQTIDLLILLDLLYSLSYSNEYVYGSENHKSRKSIHNIITVFTWTEFNLLQTQQ